MSRPNAGVVLAGAVVALLVGSTASHARAGERTGRIAFLRWPAGTAFSAWPSLFVINADGGLRPLTPRGTQVYSYEWSPDGHMIAYVDQRLSLWLVRPDGTGRRLLLPTSRLSSLQVSWSPDSKEIAVISPGRNANLRTPLFKTSIHVVPVDGGEPRLLPTRNPLGIAWSPHGDEIAYARNGGGGIWAVRTDGSSRRPIATEGGLPQWSTSGRQLAAVVGRYWGIAVVDSDGRHFHLVTSHAYNEYGFAWSPDGRRILYGRANREGIYVIDADGRNDHRVTADSPQPVDWGALAWSGDGRRFVYATDRTGNGDLYLIDADGHNRVRLTTTPDVDIDPSWVAR